MRSKKILPYLFVFILVVLVPGHVYAIDFDITEVRIDAQLNKDGTADITERFTYEFDDDFNGITRSLIEKEGTAIEDFSAMENGRPLKVVLEDDVYQIYRAGNYGEMVEIELSYGIVNAVEKFEDGAQFYWAFFDESNKSEYGNLTITVTPPLPAERVEAFGYEAAYDTEHVMDDGTVMFELGSVPEGENANVRAIFERELFPDAAALDGTVRDQLAADRERLEKDAALFAQNQQTAKNFALPIVAIAGALLLAGTLFLWMRSYNRKRQIRNYPYEFFVPKESMSIPALLYFTNSSFLLPNAISAAILELMRRGNIRQLSEDRFELIHRKTEHLHESILIGLLFDRIGDRHEFTLDGVEEFTKNVLNHEAYNDALDKWTKEVSREVKAKGLYEKHPVLHLTTGILGMLFTVLAIYTGIYELFPGMAASIALAMLAFGLAIGYSPLTFEGLEIRHHWRKLKAAMEDLPEEHWHHLTADEKQRAYAYLLGSDPKIAERKAIAFTSANPATNDSAFVLNPIFMTATFVSAGSITSASASGGSSGSGAGVGGGGGGSGAF